MTNKIVRFLRNTFSSPSYSGCGICGDSWNWKKPHDIKISDHEGAFPICEECWQTKSNEEIMRATKALIRKWLDQSPCDHFEETKRKGELLVENTEKALNERRIKL